MSYKLYAQGDCKLFRYKDLIFIQTTEPMGLGTSKDPYTPPDKWKYPPPPL